MREYTYDELQRMQEKALERVRNMQKYSEEAVQSTNTAPKTAQLSAASKAPNPVPPPPQNTQKTHGRIKMPLNLPENKDLVYPSFQEYFEPETKKTQQLSAQKTKATLLDTVLKEPDEAMLFSLLLLLKSEGADEALMMALLYIMS